jgi:hypothetical protein
VSHARRHPSGSPTPDRHRTVRRGVVLGLAAVLALGACSGGGGDAGPRRWKGYNRDRTGWIAEGRQAVERTASVLADRLGCGPLAGENFEAWAQTYRRNGLPLPLAAGTCDLRTGEPTGEPEVVFMEAFGTAPPTAADAVAARADLLCRRVERRGLPGQPYALTRDGVLVQPDRPDTARRIGSVFPGSKIGDVCPKASKRFFARSGPTTTTGAAPAPTTGVG